MAYKFESKLDVVLKIMFSELERNALAVGAMETALDDMDKLKQKTKAPIKYSADLWKIASPNYKRGKNAIDAVLRLENAYIIAEQYWTFLRATAQEINKLNSQLYIESKKIKNEPLSDELLKQDLKLSLNDCCEIYRYINVWDMNGFLMSKYSTCVSIPTKVLEEFNNPILIFSLQEMGLNNYVSELIKSYKEKIKSINDKLDVTQKKYVDLGNYVLKINAQANYKHYCPLDYNDQVRAPLGEKDDTDFKRLYANSVKRYKLKCENNKINDFQK